MWWGKVLVLVMCIQFSKVSPCTPAIPGLEKSVQFLGTVSNALSERKEDADGNILPISSSIVFFKGLSKLSSLAGGVLGLAGFIYDQFQESDFSKIKKEFGKVNQGIADLEFEFNDLAKLIKNEHVWTRMYPDLKFLDTVSTTLDTALNAADLETRNDFKAFLLTYLKNGRLLDSLNGIYFGMLGTPQLASAPDTLYDQTNGDWSAINIMSQYISGVLVQGHLAYTSACVMQKVDEDGYGNEDARQQCVNDSETYFKKKGPQYEKKIEKVLSKCKAGEMKENLMRDVEEIVRKARDRDVTPNSMVGDKISVLIREKYFWLDASVMVYDDGYEKTFRCSLWNLSDHDRNWCVMLRYKPQYRDPFTDKEERLYFEKNYFPRVVSDTKLGNIEIKYPYKVDSADQVFKMISTQLNQMGIYNFDLAVVRNFVDNNPFSYYNASVYTTTTDTEQHLFKRYSTMFLSYKLYQFVAMFSFRYEDVSFATKCPPDYGYIIGFGQDCTTDQYGWFSPTSYTMYDYVGCPVNLCRSRNKYEEQNTSGLVAEKNDSTEVIPTIVVF